MKNVLKSFFVAIAAAVLMVSCLDNSTVDNPSSSAFVVANASPNTPSLGVYVNGQLVDTAFKPGRALGYYSAAPGSYQFIYAQDTGGGIRTVDSSVFTFANNKVYSVFTIDSFPDIRSVAVEDDFYKPSSDSVLIRFFHFSPDAGQINVFLDDTTTSAAGVNYFSSRTFNDQATVTTNQDFTRITSGYYRVSFVPTNSTTPVFDTVLNLSGATVRTLFARGFATTDSASQRLSLGQIVNLQ